MTHRFRRRRPVALIVVVLLVVLAAMRLLRDPPRGAAPESLAEGTYRVGRVIDGDTLVLANEARIRLIGADTPETVKPNHPIEPFGPEATEFTRHFVRGGDVELVFDRERIDNYGRFLAYVHVEGQMLNEELIRAGLATAEIGFNYGQPYKKRFTEAQDEAIDARRGIWSLDRPKDYPRRRRR